MKRETCRIILIERFIMSRKKTLHDLAEFLVMDENKGVYRMLKNMMQKVDDGNVSP